MRKETKDRRSYARLLFVLRQERGIYLADITLRQLTQTEQDRIRGEARRWVRERKQKEG